MKIQILNKENELKFWRYVENRIEEYFFFVLDKKQLPKDTEIFMAFNNFNKMEGMALLFKKKIIQLRGSEKAVKKLLTHIKTVPQDITGLYIHKKIILKRYPNAELEFNMYRMVLHKGEEKEISDSFIQKQIVDLNESYRDEITELMKLANPRYWGKRKSEELRFDKMHPYIGIKKNGKLVSFNAIWMDQDAGIISIVATLPDYQNQGFATNLVYRAIKKILKFTPILLIHVHADNDPALHTYKKTGFKVFLKYSNFNLK